MFMCITVPKKTWANQVQEDFKNENLDLTLAKEVALDRNRWKAAMKQISNHTTPTARYWLRGKPHQIQVKERRRYVYMFMYLFHSH